jgi:hypothetical protein
MSQLPADPKKIKSRIARYEREMLKEYEIHHFIDDGSGKRYLLGPLYLLLGDTTGAIKSFAWFDHMFPDDSGEPAHTLCWALTLHHAGDLAGASHKLRQAMLSNLYLLPMLLGRKQPYLNIWHGSSDAEQEYLQYIPTEIWNLWDAGSLQWAQALYESPAFQQVRARYIEIYAQLRNEPVGPRRSQLVAEAFALR